MDLPQHQLLSGKPALLPCRGTAPTSLPEPFKVLDFHLLAVSVSVARTARLGSPGTACLPPLSMAQVYQVGKSRGRSAEPMIPGRGASTTCVWKTRRATQKHESAPAVCSPVGEGEASAQEAAVPEAVSHCGEREWKLVVSRRRRKAAALHKQEWSCDLAADRKGKVLAVTAAKFLKFASPLRAVVSQKQTCIDSIKSESAPSAVSGSKLEGQASASHDAICDSFGKGQHVLAGRIKTAW